MSRRPAALLVCAALVASLAVGCSDDEPAARRDRSTTTTASPASSTTTAPAPTTTALPGPTLPQLPLRVAVTMNGTPYSLEATQLTFPTYRSAAAAGGTATLAWDLAGSPAGTLSSSADERSVPPDTEVHVATLLSPPPAAAAPVRIAPATGNDAAGGWCSAASDPAVIGESTAADSWTAFATTGGFATDLACGSLWAAAVGQPPARLGPASGSDATPVPAAAADAFVQHVAPANVTAYLVTFGTGGFSFLPTCSVLVRPGSAPALYDPRGLCAVG